MVWVLTVVTKVIYLVAFLSVYLQVCVPGARTGACLLRGTPLQKKED